VSSDPITRLPGESVVQFYNRRLVARGRHDIEWFIDRHDRLRLRSKGAVKHFDLADPE
jgi:hypothetical protein